MIVATAVTPKNLELFLLNLEVCRHWDGEKGSGEYLLIAASPMLKGQDVAKEARRCFKTVRVMTYDKWPGVPDFPTRENFIWQATARFVESELSERFDAWLWWEQDACPLKKDWVREIEKDHKRGRQRFSGYVYKNLQIESFLDRCAVWPALIVTGKQD